MSSASSKAKVFLNTPYNAGRSFPPTTRQQVGLGLGSLCKPDRSPKKFGALFNPSHHLAGGRERRGPANPPSKATTTMFKSRIRIPRRPVLGATPSCAAAPRNLSAPFAAAVAKQQQQQQKRAIHASPARSRHHVAPLTEDGRFEKNGVPGLLSPEAFEAAYTNYQGWALDKLNNLTEGMLFSSSSPPPPQQGV